MNTTVKAVQKCIRCINFDISLKQSLIKYVINKLSCHTNCLQYSKMFMQQAPHPTMAKLEMKTAL